MSKLRTLTAATVVALAASAAPAHAKTETTHLFSKADVNTLYDASGQLIANPTGPPQAGYSFVDVDTDYRGTHAKHSKTAVGTDHVRCVVQSFDMTTFSMVALCDAQIALRGGMVFSDAQTVGFGDETTFALTGGTGKYRHLKGGTIVAKSLGEESEDADLVVTLKR